MRIVLSEKISTELERLQSTITRSNATRFLPLLDNPTLTISRFLATSDATSHDVLGSGYPELSLVGCPSWLMATGHTAECGHGEQWSS
jgi:hypothetical protein